MSGGCFSFSPFAAGQAFTAPARGIYIYILTLLDVFFLPLFRLPLTRPARSGPVNDRKKPAMPFMLAVFDNEVIILKPGG
jgi:hypothetical protein